MAALEGGHFHDVRAWREWERHRCQFGFEDYVTANECLTFTIGGEPVCVRGQT
jgi:hypothetical protein